MERDDDSVERDLAVALRRLKDAAAVPPADQRREAALMAAFDAAHSALSERSESKGRRDYWHLAAFAAVATVLLAAGVAPAVSGRRGSPPGGSPAAHTPAASRDVRFEPPGEFVMVPGAAGLPAMESGTLVRMDVPAAELPSYGVAPPAGRSTTVTADFIVAQDGLPRAVRVVASSRAVAP